MDGVILHGQRFFLAFFEGQVFDELTVFIRACIDKNAVRIAKNDGIGDFQPRRLIFDPV